MELKQALFFSVSDSVLQFPTSVIIARHVDEVGQVWFLVNRPSQQINEFDHEFLARLEFYRKGADFHIHASGKAFLVTDPEEINSTEHLPQSIREQAGGEMVLIKLKIHNILYYPYNNGRSLKIPSLRFQANNNL